MVTDLRFIIPTAGTPLPPDTNHVVRPGVGALDLTGLTPAQNPILWDQPAFWGYSKSTASSITMGAIYTSVSSGEAPLVVHASASNVTAAGSLTLSGKAINPYLHLEYTWRVTLNDSIVPSDDEITNPNTLEPVDMYIDQIGPEATFIFHEPGNFNIILTATAANGTSEQQTKLIPVSVPTYAHKWVDPDFGGGDGLQHWDASALTAGTYTHLTGVITQASSGFATGYNHTAATAQTYDTDNYNWGWFDWGGGSAHLRISGSTDNDSVTIHPGDRAIIGSDQTGVTSSTGPLLTFDPATHVAADTAHHFKVGRTYLISNPITNSGKNGVRLMGWGGAGQYTLQANANTDIINVGTGVSAIAGDRMDVHKAIANPNFTGGFTGWPFAGVFSNSADTTTQSFVLDRCKGLNTGQNKVIELQHFVSSVKQNMTLWNCDLDNRRSGVEAKRSTIFTSIEDGGHSAVVGCRFWSDVDSVEILDHHAYVTGQHSHRLRAYNDAIENVQNVNYFFNENCGSGIGTYSEFLAYISNRFRNCKFGCDASNTSNDFTSAGRFRNVVVVNNAFDGSEGGDQGIDGGIFWYSNESSFVGHNMGIELTRGIYETPDTEAAESVAEHYFDNNQQYGTGTTNPIINLNLSQGEAEVVNNVVQETSASADTINYNPTNMGADTYVQDNNLYAPNVSGGAHVVDSGASITVATLNADANNSGNFEANPGFLNPADNDFRRGAVDVKVEVVRFVTLGGSTVDEEQVIPLSAGFGIPKAIMIIQSADRTDQGSGGYGNNSFCVGYSDGTNDVCCYAQQDPEGNGEQKCFTTMVGYVTMRTQTQGPNPHHAAEATFQADQVTLTYRWHNSGTETEPCTLIAFTGDDIAEVDVGVHDDLDVSGTVTLGYQPDIFFAITNLFDRLATLGEFNNPGGAWNGKIDATFSHGVAINDGIESQMSLAWFSPNDAGPNAINTVGLYNDTLLASLADGSLENYTVDFTSFDPTGVTVTPSGSTTNAIMGYMAMKFARTVNMAIVDVTVPTSGDMTVSGVGFTPDLGIGLLMNGISAYNSSEDASYTFTQMGFDDTTIYSTMNSGLDATPNTDTAAMSREEAGLAMLELVTSSPVPTTIEVQSSSHAFNGDGVTFTMSDWPAATVRGRMLFLGVN